MSDQWLLPPKWHTNQTSATDTSPSRVFWNHAMAHGIWKEQNMMQITHFGKETNQPYLKHYKWTLQSAQERGDKALRKEHYQQQMGQAALSCFLWTLLPEWWFIGFLCETQTMSMRDSFSIGTFLMTIFMTGVDSLAARNSSILFKQFRHEMTDFFFLTLFWKHKHKSHFSDILPRQLQAWKSFKEVRMSFPCSSLYNFFFR